MEIFKIIEDYPNYEVSNLGNVRNKKTGKVLKPDKTIKGYLRVNFLKDGKLKHYLVHRLVATVFIPNPENKPQVNHIDGDKTNNQVENLEWNTYSENLKHAFRTGLNHIIITNKNNFKTNNPSVKKRQKVRCIETQQEFESLSSASRYFGCGTGSIHSSIYKGHQVLKQFHFELI